MARYHILKLTCEDPGCGRIHTITQRDTPGCAAPSFNNLEKSAREAGWKVPRKSRTHWCPEHALLFEATVKVLKPPGSSRNTSRAVYERIMADNPPKETHG